MILCTCTQTTYVDTAQYCCCDFLMTRKTQQVVTKQRHEPFSLHVEKGAAILKLELWVSFLTSYFPSSWSWTRKIFQGMKEANAIAHISLVLSDRCPFERPPPLHHSFGSKDFKVKGQKWPQKSLWCVYIRAYYSENLVTTIFSSTLSLEIHNIYNIYKYWSVTIKKMTNVEWIVLDCFVFVIFFFLPYSSLCFQSH